MKQAKYKWSEEALNQLREMADKGCTSYVIAAKLKISRNSVCSRCSRMGIRLKGYDWRKRRKKSFYEKGSPLSLSDFSC